MGGKVVFIGNIPYDLTEEQIINIFKVVGPVVSFRLVWDKETNRSKGYGFCEYNDPETASSAVRNLNNYEINGRTLKVDFADQDAVIEPRPAGAAGEDRSTRSGGGSRPTQVAANIPSSPLEAITALLQTMNANQLFDLLTQMKLLVQSQPDQARMLLAQNPQLSWALFQSMILMGAIPQSTVQQVLQQTAMPSLPAPHPAVAPPPSNYRPPMAPSPVGPGGYAPPAMDLGHLPEAQRAALMQLMQLTEQQIDALPPQQKQQILALKAQFGRR